jgi:hypothetical protein
MLKLKSCARKIHAALAAVILSSTPVLASEDDFAEMDLDQLVEVDVFAASVLSAHIHKEGDMMFGYSFKSMKMDGNKDGTNSISTSEILESYMVAPLEMTMDMHMFHFMGAPSDDLTWMVMAMYMEKEMDLVAKMMDMGGMGMGGDMPMTTLMPFTTESSGWADTVISMNYIFHRQETDFGQNKYGLTLGVSIPTGSIDEKAFNPAMGMISRLPYPMQLGSGTYDFNAGVMYMGMSESWYWGAQGIATFRTSSNDNDYRLGNEVTAKAWLNRAVSDALSLTVRLDGYSKSNIHGADPMLNPMMAPTADPDNQGGTKFSLALGADYYVESGRLAGLRFGAEFGKPFYQDLDGPQMEEDYSFELHGQFVF